MSIMKKVVEGVAHVMPDRDRDRLIEQHRYIGQPLDRLDGRQKVTGSAPFSAEYPIENLAHAALAYSAIAKGTITSVDTSAAESVPGVIAVLTHLNSPKMTVPKPFSIEGDPASGSTEVPILNTDLVSWNGQPIAVVIADTEDRAEHAASLIHFSYASETAKVFF